MPSSSETAAHAVRPARFDRPLSGPGGVRGGAGWGDPAVDASLAQAVEDGRRQGLAQGFAVGWAEGRRAAAEREAEEIAQRRREAEAARREQARLAESLLRSLADAVAAAASVAAPGYEELADVLVDGTLALTRAALARELAAVDDDLEQRVRTAVRALAGDGRLVLRLNPADVSLIAAATLPAGTVVEPDPEVAPGAVAVRGEVQRLRLDVAAAVAAAEEVLRS